MKSYLTVRKCSEGRLYFVQCMVLLVSGRRPTFREVEPGYDACWHPAVSGAAHCPLQGRVRRNR